MVVFSCSMDWLQNMDLRLQAIAYCAAWVHSNSLKCRSMIS